MVRHRLARRGTRRRTHTTQRRRRVRRVWGGMEDGASDRIRLILQDLFPEFDATRFAITEMEGYYQVNLIRCEEQARHAQRYSPRFSIYKEGSLYIGRLTSCAPVSGGEIVRRMIRLARQLGLHSIQLEDWSEVYFPSSRYGEERCAVDLPILRILLKGQSWYESLGFVSATSEEEKAQNEEVRQMPFSAFVKRLVQKERQGERARILRRSDLNNSAERNKALERLKAKPSEFEGLWEAFPQIGEDTPVYQAVQQMVEQVNATDNACESAPFRILRKMIEVCTATSSPLIQYVREDLTMTL